MPIKHIKENNEYAHLMDVIKQTKKALQRELNKVEDAESLLAFIDLVIAGKKAFDETPPNN